MTDFDDTQPMPAAYDGDELPDDTQPMSAYSDTLEPETVEGDTKRLPHANHLYTPSAMQVPAHEYADRMFKALQRWLRDE